MLRLGVVRRMTGVIAIPLLQAILVMPAVANEIMQDRCSGDVSFPSTYDGPPTGPGAVLLTRGRGASGNWSFAIHQTIDSAGHIRWWCHSTTGNWADPGTWTFDDTGASYACGDNGDCTLSVNGSVNPTDTSGWTAERSRCDNHSAVFRAQLGPDRSLKIECLSGDTGTVSQRLIGSPDPSVNGFGNRPVEPLALTFFPVQHAPAEAWFGQFVYPRGERLTDGSVTITISPNRNPSNRAIPLGAGFYQVSLNEKKPNPATVNQNMSVASVLPRAELPYSGDSFKTVLSLNGRKTVTTPLNNSAAVLATKPTVGPPGGNASGASHPAGGGLSRAPVLRNTVGAGKAVQVPMAVVRERADSLVISPEVTLMLYLVKASNNPRFSSYGIRYIRRSNTELVGDAMLLPAIEPPH